METDSQSSGKSPFTRESVAAAMKAAVAEKGEDYIYPNTRCVYFNLDGTPSCIVGQVLARHGYTWDDLGALNWGTGVHGLAQVKDLELSDDLLNALDAAQAAQDGASPSMSSRKTWGEALAVFENVLLRRTLRNQW